MKVNHLLLAATFATGVLHAASLTETTAVHSSPHTGAPAITFLKAGTQPTPAASVTAPPGWQAVELPGPHEAYVLSKDFLKSLDLKPGASIYTAPRLDAPVLATAEKGDAVEITGLLGKWTQIKLNKKLVGYIQLSPATEPVAPPAVSRSNSPVVSAPTEPPPPAASDSTGHAVNSTPNALPPRLFEGKVVSTRHLFAPRRPYDYQLNDANGSRLAYLDASHLPPSEQMSHYVDHVVTVFGPARPINNGQDFVIEIESMQLK
ncbi:MAG: SH3 domain-containing protein [Verrucomicrobiota bacterium]|nr:SH3 domain-containing protein [Verrucomicrobiota bacterium]